MHSVQRSPEPAFLSDLRSRLSEWEQLENVERRQVRAVLAEDFSRICGYCEKSCDEPTRPRKMMRRVLITFGRDIVSPTIG